MKPTATAGASVIGASTTRRVNWRFLPDAIRENEVDVQFIWFGNERTEQAIRRQAKLMGFPSAYDYLHQALAATIGPQRRGYDPRRRRPDSERRRRLRPGRVAAQRVENHVNFN
jgi:hypothetical protein